MHIHTHILTYTHMSANHLQRTKGERQMADKVQLEKEIHLVKAPKSLTKEKDKLRVAAEERQANGAMQE